MNGDGAEDLLAQQVGPEQQQEGDEQHDNTQERQQQANRLATAYRWVSLPF